MTGNYHAQFRRRGVAFYLMAPAMTGNWGNPLVDSNDISKFMIPYP